MTIRPHRVRAIAACISIARAVDPMRVARVVEMMLANPRARNVFVRDAIERMTPKQQTHVEQFREVQNAADLLKGYEGQAI